jgi:hypothetical protein
VTLSSVGVVLTLLAGVPLQARSQGERAPRGPSSAYEHVFRELSAELAIHLRTMNAVPTRDLPVLNRLLAARGLDAERVDDP